jgi:hypothetical protein
MESKNMLIALVVLTVLVNFVNYIDKDESKTIQKIDVLKKRLADEKLLLQSKTTQGVIDNRKFFFDSKEDNNRLLGAFQNEINAMALKSGFKITNTTWGEPTTNETLKLTTIPLKLNATSTPHYFAQFLKAIQSMDKIVKVDTLTMSKSHNEMSYQLYLYGYKRVASDQN